ncbi:MAG TPA: BON domain-containing protein [Roseiarcus sp.]
MGQNFKQASSGVPIEPTAHTLAEFSNETADGSNRKWERRRDEEIRLAVITALHWDLAVPRHCIEVTVRHGWVTLTGQVRRTYEKSCSEADALTIPGVVGVTNDIKSWRED